MSAAVGSEGRAHHRGTRLINQTSDALILVVGDRTPFDEVTYPDVDLHGKAGADGRLVFTRKDGTPH